MTPAWWAALDQLDPARPWALDLFASAGGAGEGLRQAGYAVLGVDQVKRACGYCDPAAPAGQRVFVKADALEVLADLEFLRMFALRHGSPPCQTHTRCVHLRNAQGKTTSIVDLIPQTREGFTAAGLPWVIENVEGAPLRADLTLCGAMFPELRVTDDTGVRWLRRHRVFELGGGAVLPDVEPCCSCVPGCSRPGCNHAAAGVRALGVYASLADNIPSGGQTCTSVEQARTLMGAPWMSWKALTEALPPAYLRLIGEWQLGAQPALPLDLARFGWSL